MLATAIFNAKDSEPEPDTMIMAIARTFDGQEKPESRQLQNVQALAIDAGVDKAYIRRQLHLNLPDRSTVKLILNGNCTPESINTILEKT